MSRIATIGFFDGVHKGHQYLFDHLRREAGARACQSLIVTFNQHPRSVLQTDYVPRLLNSVSERIELLRTEADSVEVMDFSQIHALTASQFLQILHDQYDVRCILMGYDHRFGSDRLSSFQAYSAAGHAAGVEVLSLNAYQDGEWHVSSTEIRRALETGNIIMANELLGRPYSLTGKVVHGNGIGRGLGFPTANVKPDDAEKIIPYDGVYAGEADNKPAVINIGTNPTIGNQNRTIEVHIPGIQKDLYDSPLTIRFERRIRDERQFGDRETLRAQIQEDINELNQHIH